MNFIKSELDKEFKTIGLRNQRKNLRTLPQTNVKNLDIERDKSRKALAAGKRISKNGKVYWETRANRSDKVGSKV